MNSLLYLVTVFFLISPIYGGMPSIPGLGGQGAVQQGGLMKMPSEAEMKEINDFLATLSEDELKELAKLGEEIIATAEKEGVPLFYPADPNEVPGNIPPFEPMQPTQPIKKTELPKPIKKVEQSTQKATKNILSNLIKIINEIKKKVATDPLLTDSFSKLNEQTNTFLYYLNVATDTKITQYLADKEFETLYKHLIKLEKELEELAQNFDVPNKHTMKITPYTKAMKVAETTLNKIITLLEKTFSEQNSLKEFEKLIKKYDPEALKIKKELEIQERAAHEATKKIPVTNTGKSTFMPSRTMAENTVQSPFNISNSTQPLKMPNFSQKQEKQQKPSKQDKPFQLVKNHEKKSNTSQKIKPTLADLERNVKTQFDKVEASLTPHKEAIVNYFANNSIICEEPECLKKPLSDTNFELKKLKKAVTKWHDSLEKIAHNSSDYRIKIKPLQDFYQSEKHNTLKLVHNHIKNSSQTRRVSLDGNFKQFKSFMDDIEKKLTGNQA